MRVWIGLLLAVMGMAGQTPDVFIVPGEVAYAPAEVAAYSSDPFLRVGTIPTQPYVTIFLAHPDGTRFYSISRLGPDGVRVISSTAPYAELKRLPVVDTQAAAISPDGRRLVLIGTNNATRVNTVTILDLQTDTVAAEWSIPYILRHQVVMAADSSRAFFLTVSPGLLYAVDLMTNALAPNPLSMPVGEVVRVGPNGLVYVAAGENVLEVDGKTLTPWDAIRVSPRQRTPALELSRDGEYGITARALINLRTRKVTATPSAIWEASRITDVGPSRVFVDHSEMRWTHGAEETMQLSPLPQEENWATVTGEFFGARYHLANWPDTLRRYPIAGSIGVFESLAAPRGSLIYQTRQGSGAAATLVGFQAEQTVRSSDNPKPMVARVLNSDGRPLAGIAVSFQSTIRSATVLTDAHGNAVLNLTPGLAPGRYTVSASASGLQAVTYGVTVLEDPSGPRRLTVVAGAAQYQTSETFLLTYTPITVLLQDSFGTPRPREAVTFRMRSNLGTLGPVTAATCASGECTVLTDAEGKASIDFVPSEETFARSAPSSETVIASSGGATVEVLRTIIPRTGGLRIERQNPTGPAISGVAGAAVPNGVRVLVYFGNTLTALRIPLPSLRVSIETLAAVGTDLLCETVSDSAGFATCNFRLPATVGRWSAVVTVGGSSMQHWKEFLPLITHSDRPQVELKPAASGEAGAPERTFEMSAFRPGTETPFGILNLLVNSALDGRRACYVAYSLADDRLYLVNDEGPQAGLSAPLALGSAGSVSNGQCTVFGSGSSFSGTSSRPVLRVRIRFADGFGGARLVQIASRTQNDTESSGWQTADVITLPTGNLATGPRVEPMSPSVRESGVVQLDFKFADATGGAANLLTVWGLIGPSIDAGQGCVFAYYAPGNLIALYPDNGIPTGTMVPFVLGTTLENSRCRLEPVLADKQGNGLLLRVLITAKAAFAGSNVVWGAASTLQNAVSPWTPIAAWRVQVLYN